jgi:hypothetical protein
MDLKQAVALIGREADIRTADGFVARVHVLDALSAYGRVRLKVVQPGESARAAVIDGDRFVRDSGPFSPPPAPVVAAPSNPLRAAALRKLRGA